MATDRGVGGMDGHLSPEAFRRFCVIAFEEAGIKLRPGKEALVAGRVARRVRSLGLTSADEYLRLLDGDDVGDELVHFIDAISTNHTRFNREAEHFVALGHRVEAWLRAGRDRLRFWSAASSSGEEPYSMAIAIEQASQGYACDYRILATDISTTMLAQGRRGVYRASALDELDESVRRRFFDRVDDDGEPAFRVKDFLRRRVVFRRLNLVRPPFPMRGPFQAVFCRNVMIYFDHPDRQRLISAIEALLEEGGEFFVGHAESLAGISHGFDVVHPSHYRKSEVRS